MAAPSQAPAANAPPARRGGEDIPVWVRETRRRLETAQINSIDRHASGPERYGIFASDAVDVLSRARDFLAQREGQGTTHARSEEDLERELGEAIAAFRLVTRNLNLKSLWWNPHQQTAVILGRPVQVSLGRSGKKNHPPLFLSLCRAWSRPFFFSPFFLGPVSSQMFFCSVCKFMQGPHTDVRDGAHRRAHALLSRALQAAHPSVPGGSLSDLVSAGPCEPDMLRLVQGPREKYTPLKSHQTRSLEPWGFSISCEHMCVRHVCVRYNECDDVSE